MSRFTKLLVVSPLPDGRFWALRRSFAYAVGDENSDDVIDVPCGFVTDLASVPRFLWIFLPRWGKYGNAAIIHDWLYWTQERTRAESDAIFREAMHVLGVSRFQEIFMYYGVRLVGYIGWWIDRTAKEYGYNKVIEIKDTDTVFSVSYAMPGLLTLIKWKITKKTR